MEIEHKLFFLKLFGHLRDIPAKSRDIPPKNRGHKIEPKHFFSQTFRALPGYPGKIPGYPAKKSLIPWVSRDIPNFLAPTPSRGRPPPHQKISGLKSLGLGSFFVPEKKFDFPGFEGTVTWKTPTPLENIRTKKVWVWVLFFRECQMPL